MVLFIPALFTSDFLFSISSQHHEKCGVHQVKQQGIYYVGNLKVDSESENDDKL